jgi:hypothetical protein
MFNYYSNVHPFWRCSFQIGWMIIDMNVITNLLDFIGSYKFYAKSGFRRFIQKLHEFHVMVNMNDVCMYLIF